MKRRGLDVERPEARGAVVGRWFLPEWWARTLPPARRDNMAPLRLAQFAAAVAAVVVVLLVLAAGSSGR